MVTNEIRNSIDDGTDSPDNPIGIPTNTKKKNSRSIPDFNAYLFDCDPDLKYEKKTDSDGVDYNVEIVHTVSGSKTDIVDEYINLLCNDYNFKLTKSEDKTGTYFYYFDYTGIDSSSLNKFDWSTFGYEKSNLVIILHSRKSVWIYASDGLEYGDYGDRTSYDIPKNDSNSGGFGNISGGDNGGDDVIIDWPSKQKKKCSDCNGKGKVKCSYCDGSGYVEKYMASPNYSGDINGGKSGMQKVMCSYCFRGEERCRTCSGTGYV